MLRAIDQGGTSRGAGAREVGRRWLLGLVACGALLASGRGAEAGAPPLNQWYRDSVHKFSLKIFRDYERVPLPPGAETDGAVVCRFADPKTKGQNVGTFDVEIEVVRVAQGPAITGEAAAPEAGSRESWMEAMRPKTAWDATIGRQLRWTEVKPETLDRTPNEKLLSKDKVEGEYYTYAVPMDTMRGEALGLFMALAVYRKDDVEMGIYMTCGEKLRKDYERRFKDIAKSFSWFDRKSKDVESLDVLSGVNISARRRADIERGLVSGWDVRVSPKKNYIVVYNTNNGRNRLLAEIISDRIEKIREQIYEVQFPPAEPITAVSIVRICKDRNEYIAYGAPPGSAGYWSSGDEELVFYDASPSKKPDDDTLAVLYHEAFHQYIFYSVGNVAPHSWFNEGHGDYYAGADYEGGRFVIKPFQWRVGTIRGALVQGHRPSELKDGRRVYSAPGYTPLADFVRFTQGEYYSYPGVCYAQGWSLVYFLREIVPKKKEYKAKWGHILETYFRVLKEEVAKDDGFSAFRPRPEDDDDDGGGGKEGPDAPPGDEGDGTPPTEPGTPPLPPDAPPPLDDEEAANTAAMQTGGFGPAAALERAVTEAFKGVDWEEFEKAWAEGTKRGK